MAPPPWWCVPVPRRGVSQPSILTLENFLYEIVPRPNRARGRIVAPAARVRIVLGYGKVGGGALIGSAVARCGAAPSHVRLAQSRSQCGVVLKR